MRQLGWYDWLGVTAVAIVIAVAAFFGLLQIQHWRQDEETLHAIVQLLNYNVAQGRLLAVPAPQLPPPPPEKPKAH